MSERVGFIFFDVATLGRIDMISLCYFSFKYHGTKRVNGYCAMEAIMVDGTLGRLGIVICLATAPLFVSTVCADEIDEILRIESAVGGSRKAPAAASATVAAAPVMSTSGASQELSAAREEIFQLKQQLQAQEARHRTELLFAHYNMGCVYKASRNYDRAENEFLKALSINPDDASVHYNLGILYDDDLGKKAKARMHYNRFLELAPNDKDVQQVQEWLALLDD